MADVTVNVDNFIEQPGSGSDNLANFDGSVFSNKITLSATNIVTLAESNAGKTIVPGVDGKIITIVGFDATVSGTYASTTSVDLEDTNGSPVAIATMLVAALTDGAVLDSTTTNVTMGVGFLGALTVGEGIAVTNTGSAGTGGTSITISVQYRIN